MLENLPLIRNVFISNFHVIECIWRRAIYTAQNMFSIQNSHDNKRFISELGKQCGIVKNIRDKDASFVVKVNQMSLYIEAGKPKIWKSTNLRYL